MYPDLFCSGFSHILSNFRGCLCHIVRVLSASTWYGLLNLHWIISEHDTPKSATTKIVTLGVWWLQAGHAQLTCPTTQQPILKYQFLKRSSCSNFDMVH